MTDFIKSPLNYTGGKYKLLPQLLKLFPCDIDTFVDMFAGGLNVGINVPANRVIANDYLEQIIELYTKLAQTTGEEAKADILSIVDKHGLSKTNKEGYLQLREDYNEGQKHPYNLYALITHAFNNQIRFNKSGGYNMPFGKDRSHFNPTLQKRFVRFVDALDDRFMFYNRDFRDLATELELDEGDFVYCDPPYLISTATYNENGGWNIQDESDLIDLLDTYDHQGVRFALSNALVHKGEENDLLIRWAEDYNVIPINSDYTNASYQKKSRVNDTQEVLVTNYEKEN